MQLKETFERVRAASKSLTALTDQQRNEILQAVANAIIDFMERILVANAQDLAKMDPKNPLYDRLQLTQKRLEDIAGDMRNVANLPSPLGHVTKEKTLPNGLRLHRVSVPFGVIGMIYEARPNVTFDVFSLCFKNNMVSTQTSPPCCLPPMRPPASCSMPLGTSTSAFPVAAVVSSISYATLHAFLSSRLVPV